MKIAILVSSLDDGGAAAIVSQITSNLSDEFDVDIILNHARSIRFPYRGKIIDIGINNVPKDKTNLAYQIRVFFRRMYVLSRLKKKNKYDVCISYLDSANVVNVLTKGSCRECKTVLNVVNNMSGSAKSNKKYRYIVNPLIKLFYNNADGIIAQTQDIKTDLISNYNINENIIHVSYSAVDIDKIDKIISDSKNEDEAFFKEWIKKDKTIITAGRFVPQKGHWHLIRAFAKVVAEIPDANLVIFGDGELKDYYNQLIDDYHLRNNVAIHGFDAQYVWYISRSAIFCLPSVYEGFGMVLQDAMACNVACVATDYKTGARELLANGYDGNIDDIYYGENGIITKSVDEKLLYFEDDLSDAENCLTYALVELLQNEEYRGRISKSARKKSEQYNICNITREWERIIKNIEVGS